MNWNERQQIKTSGEERRVDEYIEKLDLQDDIKKLIT